MNKYFSYENIELWEDDKWSDKITKTVELVQWLGNNSEADHTPYPKAIDGFYGEDAKKISYYHKKTNSLNPPEMIDRWANKGITYGYRAQGILAWLFMVPTEALKTPKKKLKTLVVMNKDTCYLRASGGQ